MPGAVHSSCGVRLLLARSLPGLLAQDPGRQEVVPPVQLHHSRSRLAENIPLRPHRHLEPQTSETSSISASFRPTSCHVRNRP
ncbi:unnamed protein product, partial [Ixodes persulcatus]